MITNTDQSILARHSLTRQMVSLTINSVAYSRILLA